MGAMTLGCGPAQVYCLVEGATNTDCTTLTRLWLSDELPANSESRVIGIVLRSLRGHSGLKFVVSYADPSAGHIGTIYQAGGWLYTGLSQTTPLFDLGDGVTRHSRTFSSIHGTRSAGYLAGQGIDVKAIPQQRKHRYVVFLEPSWTGRLKVPVLPYPKKESSNACR